MACIIVFFLFVFIDYVLISPAEGLKTFSELKKAFARAMVGGSLLTGLPQTSVAFNPAPLADVGLKEFLVKDGGQHLRLTLPSGVGEMLLGKLAPYDNAREAQEDLELVRLRFEQLGYTNPSVWKQALKDLGAAEEAIMGKKAPSDVTSARPGASPAEKAQFDKTYAELGREMGILGEALRKQDIAGTAVHQQKAAELCGDIRSLRYPPNSLPYSIPEEYAGLPRLKGRAEVKLSLATTRPRGFRLEDGQAGPKSAELTLVVDGFHAPLTAGNFVDLVNQKSYDGMGIEENQELFVLTGKGANGKHSARKVPLEIFYKNDAQPTWGITSDDDGRATETPALPFQAYGALGMMRENDDVDSATSQWFLLKWQQALIPPGRNTMDGYYCCFGYVTSPEAQNIIRQLDVGDTIVKAEIVSGLENLSSS